VKSWSLLLGLAALNVLLLSAAWAGAGEAPPPTADGPQAQIKQSTDKILAVVRDPDLEGDDKKEERRKKILDAVDERFNWTEMARRALARHWRARTPEEQKEFVPLFTELVRRTYMRRVEGYAGEKVVYKGERVDGLYARVNVEIISTKNTEVPVVYSMKKHGAQWLVYDMAIEGVRLVNNYRTQFNSMLNGMSYREFVEKLKAKVAAMKDE
jgi:phospholipid transport system substrate-binding protein